MVPIDEITVSLKGERGRGQQNTTVEGIQRVREVLRANDV